jgi:hypothetical protein
LILKTAPFEEDSDDVISFITEVQLSVTFFVGFALLTDDKGYPKFNPRSVDIFLVVINCFGFAALIIGNCHSSGTAAKAVSVIEMAKKKIPKRRSSVARSPMENPSMKELATEDDSKENEDEQVITSITI